MQSSGQSPAMYKAENLRQAWMTFFRNNNAKLFQTALLLCADAEVAEACLAKTIDNADMSRLPAPEEFKTLQDELVRNVARSVIPKVPKTDEASSLLQKDMRPVLLLERSSRICFVLRIFLGYATSVCAQILGIEETAIRNLLRTAIFQLHKLTAEHSINLDKVKETLW